MGNFALQTWKTSKTHHFFMKKYGFLVCFHGFPCQNLHSAAAMLTAGQFAPLGGLPSRAPQSCLYKAGFGCTRHHESIGFLIELL